LSEVIFEDFKVPGLDLFADHTSSS